MKVESLYKFIFILSFIFSSLNTSSQITIGSNEQPVSGALLQIKNMDEKQSSGLENATKGLGMPRVLLTKKHQLLPMFSNQLGDYNNNKATYDAEHIGLLVYNPEANIDEIICKGLNVWDGEQWQCLNRTVNYSIDCSSVIVHGVYRYDEMLDPEQHYIELDLTTDINSIGSIYHIKTQTIDGISFEGKGILTSTSQTVKLQGKGKSTNYETKNFTISTNSTGDNSTCSANVYIVLPSKRILVLANGLDYGYNPSITNTGSYKVLTSPNNFGVEEYSTFKYEGNIFMNHVAPYSKSYNFNVDSWSTIRKGLLEDDEKIDIVLLAQDVYLSKEAAAILGEYVNQGGVLIALYEGNLIFQNYPEDTGTDRRGSTTFLMQAIWGQTENDFGYSAKINTSPGYVYPLTKVDDKILNGPFGDVRGLHWGEDASWVRAVKRIPLDDIVVYSYGNHTGSNNAALAEMIGAFRHKTKNFVYFGDGGFTSSKISGNKPAPPTETICPFYWKDDGTFTPIPRTGYGKSSANKDVYNSTIFCNIMAWAIYQAHFHGINTK